ncbi:MAG: type II secretion system protein N [Pacificimonas sp.]|jgi:general secretion pathway protein N|nr:type II secretion system protein N [Pacificimonas sp.]
MKRFRLDIRRAALITLLSVFAIAALLPMQTALSALGFQERGFSARQVDGSVWSAQMREAWLGNLPLGDPAARLSTWRLLIGQAQLRFRSGDDDDPGPGGLSGALTGYRSGYALNDLTGSIAVADLGFPGAGRLTLQDVSVRFEDGQCVEAGGTANTDALTAAAGAFGLPAATLQGALACQGDQAQLPLTGSLGTGSAALMVELSAAGTVTAWLDITGVEQANGPALLANGFTETGPGRYRLTL